MLETAERLVIEDKQPALQQFLLLVGGLRAMRWRAPPGPGARRLPAAVPGRRGLRPLLRRLRALWRPGSAPRFNPASGGMLCGDCRVPGSAGPAAETLSLLGALLAGDWPAVHAADPRHLREASGLVAAYLAWHLERGLRSWEYVER